MEQFIAITDYIAAAGRLYQYSQNKRYQVTNNEFVKDDIGNVAIYINELIKTNYGLDIFSIKSIENIHEYERRLNSIVTEYTTRRISHRDVTDEAEIIRKSEMVDTNKLKNKEILVSQSFADQLSSLPLSQEELINLCYNPLRLAAFQGYSPDSRENYLLNALITIDGDTYYIFSHLTNETGRENSLSIVTVFIVSQELGVKYADNPARSFLFCLDKYGMDIEINGKTKKIFGKETVLLSKPFDGNLNFLKVNNVDKKGKFYFSLALKVTTEKSIEMEFVYGVNMTKYLEELNKIIKKS